MKILTGTQIAQADRYTIEHESIESIDLMERAAEVIAQWICNRFPLDTPLCFLIGKGNNGGDGLAVARILYNAGFLCSVYTVFGREELSPDCRYNLDRLPRGLMPAPAAGAEVPDGGVIVDAVLGSGVQGAVTGPAAAAIAWMNAQDAQVVSIDLPSGMPTGFGGDPTEIVHAAITLALEFPKLGMLQPGAGECSGEIVVLPIGLDSGFIEQAESVYCFVDESFVEGLRLPRPRFAHKGNFGHALLVCGSEGMVGAAVLATGAALRSGCGLVTVHLPASERQAVYATNPSAMVSGDPASCFSRLPDQSERFTSIGVGCGLGQHEESIRPLRTLLELGKPTVIDADALNLLAVHPELQKYVPAGSILTPHPGELRRLIGSWDDDSEKVEKVRALATRLNACIVVKGAHTMICTPDGRCLFNSTGNPGMAKGGSGDVLTGLITGLLARGYAPKAAASLGVWLHGRAGDEAAAFYGPESMNSADILEFIHV